MENVDKQDYLNNSGKFKKGNPGRPKGIKDKRTRTWDDLGEYLVNEGAQRVMEVMSNLDDEEFIRHFKDLMEYFKPKQSRIEAKVESTHRNFTFTPPVPKRAIGEGYNMIRLPNQVEEAEVIPEEKSVDGN